MSNLVNFAEQELELAGMGEDSTDINKMMHDNIIDVVKAFSGGGHSGFSAGYALGVLTKLLAFEPLSPLTGEDSEWTDVSEMSGEPMWQNNRCFRVFKGADGKAYDVEGKVFRDPDGSTWTNRDSRTPVTFPYTPIHEYVDREEAE